MTRSINKIIFKMILFILIFFSKIMIQMQCRYIKRLWYQRAKLISPLEKDRDKVKKGNNPYLNCI